MILVKNTFNDRSREVETYYSFIAAYINTSRDADLNKILKSNLLLMLYNLVESTMTNAVEEIHNGIHAKGVLFDDLKEKIRIKLISFLRTHINSDEFVTSVSHIALDIVKQCFSKSKLFSGNVDARKIRNVSETYGFDCRTVYADTKDGHCLVTIKDRRNELAHGIFSFKDVGHNYSIQDLEDMKKETIHYMSQILNNIDDYMTNELYRTAQTSTPASAPTII